MNQSKQIKRVGSKLICTIVLICVSSILYSQNTKKRDVHKTIIEIDYGFELGYSGKNINGEKISKRGKFTRGGVNLKYTNSFFVTDNLSFGLAVGIETGPISELPVTINVRKYFNEQKSFVSFDIGKAFYRSAKFKTWLSEVGVGKRLKISEQSNLNFGAYYKLTYLNNGVTQKNFFEGINHADYFFMHSLSLRVGIEF
jgi:hypothetical protein